MGYREEFAAGDQEAGAYVCHLTIDASKLTIQPGGPLAFSSIGATESSTIQAYAGDLLGPALLIPGVAAVVAEAAPVFQSLVLPTVEQLLAAAAQLILLTQNARLPPGSNYGAHLKIADVKHFCGI